MIFLQNFRRRYWIRRFVLEKMYQKQIVQVDWIYVTGRWLRSTVKMRRIWMMRFLWQWRMRIISWEFILRMLPIMYRRKVLWIEKHWSVGRVFILLTVSYRCCRMCCRMASVLWMQGKTVWHYPVLWQCLQRAKWSIIRSRRLWSG